MNQTFDFDQKTYLDLRRGHEYAFDRVFQQYSEMLYALAYRYLKSGAEAEDAVQHTFMKLWSQRKEFDFQTGVKNLLITILKNYVWNELRHRQVVFEKHYEISQMVEEQDNGFLGELENKEFKEHLWAAINDLPPQKRRICQLKIGRGLSNQEIADIMQITIPTVKSHYTQAIKLLRNAIEPLIVLLHAVWFHYFV